MIQVSPLFIIAQHNVVTMSETVEYKTNNDNRDKAIDNILVLHTAFYAFVYVHMH